jgi:hypothetical protein
LYTSSTTTPTWTTTNAAGCDSAVTLNLTINTSTHTATTQSACGSYSWHGTTYTISGNYLYNYTNTNGCASSDTLHLTISTGVPVVTTTSNCVSYTWNGTTYTSSGTYLYNYPIGSGCTTTDTLHLTIKQPTSSTETITSCDSLKMAWSVVHFINHHTNMDDYERCRMRQRGDIKLNHQYEHTYGYNTKRLRKLQLARNYLYD